VNPGEIHPAAKIQRPLKVLRRFPGKTSDNVAGQEGVFLGGSKKGDPPLQLPEVHGTAHPFQDGGTPGLEGQVEVGPDPGVGQDLEEFRAQGLGFQGGKAEADPAGTFQKIFQKTRQIPAAVPVLVEVDPRQNRLPRPRPFQAAEDFQNTVRL
jgi:hypothetical protein